MNLGRFPRIALAHLPTPLEPMDRLSDFLGGPRLWIKRDDCTGLATGGNKTRKLEYLLADALEQGADTIITTGATQSNHARQTAAASARLGLPCHIVLEEPAFAPSESYRTNGNILLDRMFDAVIAPRPHGSDMDAEMEALAEELRRDGATPYVIPAGGSSPVGALGYVGAALELVYQASEMGLRIDHAVHATGSAGTQAGFVAGLEAVNAGIPVRGFCVGRPCAVQDAMVIELAERTASHLGLPGLVKPSHIETDDRFIGEGYGFPTEGMIEAVTLLARTEAILLDPVYSGKAMAGLIAMVRDGAYGPDENVVFLHTGGVAGLFGYPDAFGDGI